MVNHPETRFEHSTIEIAINRAIDFLWHNQLPDGEFKTYAGPLVDGIEKDWHFESALFVSSFVVYSLSFRETSQTKVMREKALDFLAAHKETFGVWRYWFFKDSKRRFIPPDLDDTCCISFVLKKYRTTPNNHSLILANRNREGLFYTWILPRFSMLFRFPRFWFAYLPAIPFHLFLWRNTEAKADDIDCGVNANVILYLGNIEETKEVIAYLIDVTLKGLERERDKWYLSSFSHYYFLSRAYLNGVRELEVVKPKIISNLEQMFEHEGYNNPLDTALLACTFLNLEHITPTLDKAISFLLKTQGSDGSWTRVPFYFGGRKRLYAFGSSELTTAFCIEALARYQQISTN